MHEVIDPMPFSNQQLQEHISYNPNLFFIIASIYYFVNKVSNTRMHAAVLIRQATEIFISLNTQQWDSLLDACHHPTPKKQKLLFRLAISFLQPSLQMTIFAPEM